MKFRITLFISRVAIICNLFFLICLVLRYTNLQLSQVFAGFLLISGWIMSPVLNFIACFLVIFFLLKKTEDPVPVWMKATNLFFLFFQIFYFILLLN